MEPGTFIDYRGLENDTLDVTFKTTSLEKYTEIILELKNVNEQQLIVQLFNASGNMVNEQIITEDTKLTFEYLLPVKYKVKIITDKNKNGLWDTGNYDLKQQPEKVLFFDEEIETKANWSHDIIWDLEKDSEKEPSEEPHIE